MERLAGAYRTPAGGGFPVVNVYASADGIAVVAELPGVEKDDLEIQAHRRTLTLRAAARLPSGRRPTIGGSAGAAHSLAASPGHRIDPDRIEAQLENGVLRLSPPRPEEDKPRRISIGG